MNISKFNTAMLGISALALITACTPETTSNEPAVADEIVVAEPTAPEITSPTILATYPTGTFLENLEVQANGSLLYTSYFAKTIERLSPDGSTDVFANLSAFPLSIITTAEGYVVAAHGKSFIAGDDFVNAQEFLILDQDGQQVGQFDAPDARALNGMVWLDDTTLLAADSLASTIWKVDHNAGSIEPWLQHEMLATLPDLDRFYPGVNGLKIGTDGLIASNTAQGTLLRIPVGPDGNPAGEPEVKAEVGIIDDFWIREDGSILFTTHTETLKLLSTDGVITEVLSEGCGGCTAIAPFPPNQSKTFAFVNDGGFYLGEPGEATVVSVTVD